jgi:hypothetical protein
MSSINLLARARAAVGRVLADGLWTALSGRRPRIIYGHDAKSEYLSRWYLVGSPRMPDGSEPFDRFGNPRRGAVDDAGLGLYVHRFHRSDADRQAHNHPWQWALSFVIAGGYREERRLGNRLVSRIVPPLSFNFIGADDFHRVELLEHDAWSLFLVGPKVASWSFWDPRTGEVTPWRDFIAKKRAGVS